MKLASHSLNNIIKGGTSMALNDLFKKKPVKEVEEEVVDPIIVARRQEKFSKPFLFEEEEKTPVTEEKQDFSKTTKFSTKKRFEADTFQPTEIISPIFGKSSKELGSHKVSSDKKIERPFEEQLIQVISPMYGIKNSKSKSEVKSDPIIHRENDEKPATITQNLRDMANIVKDIDENINIVEVSTGEFQLNFSDNEENPSMIDQVNEQMSLDELMQLYEEKFKE